MPQLAVSIQAFLTNGQSCLPDATLLYVRGIIRQRKAVATVVYGTLGYLVHLHQRCTHVGASSLSGASGILQIRNAPWANASPAP